MIIIKGIVDECQLNNNLEHQFQGYQLKQLYQKYFSS